MQFYVKDIMTTDLITIKENASIKDAIKIFSNNQVSGLPVLDQNDTLVGVISASDIIENESSRAFFSAPFREDFELELLKDSKFLEQPVSSIMSTDLYIIEPDATIASMSEIMYKEKIHRLLVAEYDKLIGIVSAFDVLKLHATSDQSIVT